jgi:hypothetical protein
MWSGALTTRIIPPVEGDQVSQHSASARWFGRSFQLLSADFMRFQDGLKLDSKTLLPFASQSAAYTFGTRAQCCVGAEGMLGIAEPPVALTNRGDSRCGLSGCKSADRFSNTGSNSADFRGGRRSAPRAIAVMTLAAPTSLAGFGVSGCLWHGAQMVAPGAANILLSRDPDVFPVAAAQTRTDQPGCRTFRGQ